MLKYFLKNFAAILLSISLVSNCWAGIDFDSVDDVIQIADNASIDLGNTGSISFWIKHSDTNHTIYLGKQTGDADANSNYRIELFSGSLYLTIGNGTSSNQIARVWSVSTNIWYHILGLWDGSNLKIFVNGSQLGTSQSQTIIPSGNGSVLDIGAERSKGSPGYMGAIIDEVAIWNVALSVSEIALLASSRIKGIPLQIQPSALKGYWPMDDQETGTSADTDNVRDLSGNGNNGTGDNGANNTGLSWTGESILSYQPIIAMFGGSGAVIATIPSLIINGTVFIQNMIVQ